MRRWFDARRPADPLDRLLLQPLAALVARVARARLGRRARQAPGDRPLVLVVGNLVVGGAGKTPLVIALAAELGGRGWRVGLLARGHHARRHDPRLVGPDDEASEQGDEAVLLARESALPVAAGHDRAAALALLSAQHPDLDLVISDDGLQHARLPRRLELAVFDERGAGNGRVLPAGPLREPLAHLARVDAVAWRDGATNPAMGPVRASLAAWLPARQTDVAVLPVGWRRVGAAPGSLVSLEDFARTARDRRVLALAGIGHPARFFETVRGVGVDPQVCVAMPDHAALDTAVLDTSAELIVMTSKDAVKFAAIDDPRCWCLVVSARCDPALIDWIEGELRGSPTA